MTKFLVIQSYMLHYNTMPLFHRCIVEFVLPIFAHLNIDVMFCGSSRDQRDVHKHGCCYALAFSCRSLEECAQVKVVLDAVHQRDVYNAHLSGFEFYHSTTIYVDDTVLRGLGPTPDRDDVSRVLVITLYTLHGNDWRPFHLRMTEHVLPVLEHNKIDVVFYGPSDDQADYESYGGGSFCSYALILAYASFAEREYIEDTLYRSDEWLKRAQKAMNRDVFFDSSFALDVDEATIEELRRLQKI